MKKDKKKFLILGVLSLFIFSSSFVLVGCNTNTVEEEVINKEIFLDCESTSLVVGEETTVSVSNKESDKEYYFISSNEDVATVSEDGVVKGINEGSAKISVFQKDDFNVTASVVINVFNSIEETETSHNLSIDTSNAVMEFSLGDPFVTDGLKVLVDGVEVETYSTNPSVGTTLSLLGENTIYVSYPGCESVSYKVNVVPNPLDTRLYDYKNVLGVTPLTKKEGQNTNSIHFHHCMDICGVHIVDDKPIRWKVEDSFGNALKNKGYSIMNDNFFDKYVFAVIIHKKYLSQEQLEAWNQKPIEF